MLRFVRRLRGLKECGEISGGALDSAGPPPSRGIQQGAQQSEAVAGDGDGQNADERGDAGPAVRPDVVLRFPASGRQGTEPPRVRLDVLPVDFVSGEGEIDEGKRNKG